MEIGAALGASIRTGSAKATFAWGLSRLPLAREALLAGAVQPVAGAPADHRDQPVQRRGWPPVVDTELTGKAGRLSVAELGRRAARLVAELDPDRPAQTPRDQAGRAVCGVRARPGRDGLAVAVWADRGPAAAYTAITARALQARRAGDESPLGVLRFDAAIDLLTSPPDQRPRRGSRS